MRFFRLFRANVTSQTSAMDESRPVIFYMLIRAIPFITIILSGIFGYCIYNAKLDLENAMSRNALTQIQSLSYQITQTLRETRNQLLFLAAADEMDLQSMIRRLSYRTKDKSNTFRELAFIGRNPDNRFIILNNSGEITLLPPEAIKEARNNPFDNLPNTRKQGRVDITGPTQVSYSMVPINGSVQGISFMVMRFFTPVYGRNGEFMGVLMLSLDMQTLRNTLSLFSSSDSPIGDDRHDFEHIRSVLFDPQGWILFQSESPEAANMELSTDAVRKGMNGDFGRPDFSIAFRPNGSHEHFWHAVTDVKSGKTGQITIHNGDSMVSDGAVTELISYAPVFYSAGNGAETEVIGGVVTLDTGSNVNRATNIVWSSLAVSIILSLVLICTGIYMCTQKLVGELNAVTDNLKIQNANDTEHYLPRTTLPYELQRLCNEVNILYSRLKQVKHTHTSKENERIALANRQPAANMPPYAIEAQLGVVIHSRVMRDLMQQVKKTASFFADVLLIGETGTGKEVIANAIHRASERSEKPFISINCGALDENLLMDTLFGHVKGAFTEAVSDRKGAFQAAEGGTLMLDEIGNATPRVQQALLRALATRNIRPLGSDREIPFNARIIAATNVDLREEANRGDFREDLYYRLAVITINTPPLRDRKEDIPYLAKYFLAEAVQGQDREAAILSQGALDKMMEYDWPGNVRQLKNTLTRASAFSENGMIYAEGILFNERGESVQDSAKESGLNDAETMPAPVKNTRNFAEAAPQTADGNAAPIAQKKQNRALEQRLQELGLNARQSALYPRIYELGSVNRQEYQSLAGGGISPRTAQYDLQEMVRCGLLVRTGRGPAMRYAAQNAEVLPQSMNAPGA